MSSIRVRYAKESRRAVCPERMSKGASGYDLFARMNTSIPPGATRVVPTGIFLEIPDGFEAQVRGRGSLAAIGLFVQIGTIDSDYRGEISVVIHNSNHAHYTVERDQRIAQLVFAEVAQVEFAECAYNDLGHTERGRGGFGSTGDLGDNGGC
jgi:dUTP pyrophosphatase